MDAPRCRLCGQRHYGSCHSFDAKPAAAQPKQAVVVLPRQFGASPQPKKADDAKPFDRAAYQQQYMRAYMPAYMRSYRARKREEAATLLGTKREQDVNKT